MVEICFPNWEKDIQNNRYLSKGFLSNYFSILQEHNITYLNMLGNDDLLSVDNLFEQTCGGFANVHNIAGKKICIDEYEFIGMNQILDHPFG